jgi:hypothetical protein
LHGVTLCPNYIITRRALVLPDQTLYTAHELAQMIPLSGLDVYDEIRRENAWGYRFLPNSYGAPDSISTIRRIPDLAKPSFFEAWMVKPPFDRLETWEMDRKIRRLRHEQGHSPEAMFTADVCKGHDRRHQERTRLALEARLKLLENL